MHFGYDEHNNRIKPSASGQRAICPLCGSTVIGKCGEIYRWHWQHHNNKECDSWKENETAWHRKWKKEFPEDWQEIIIEANGEKHIADVKTSKGTVIEFQNSSISTSTIRVRENFYKDMIWVVNAEPFEKNLSIRSVVTSRLRNLDRNKAEELSDIEKDYDDQHFVILKQINVIRDKKEKLNNNINSNKQSIEQVNEALKDFDNYIDMLTKKWAENEYFWGLGQSDILNKIGNEYKDKLREKYKTINELNSQIIANEQRLKDIQELENYEIENKQFKIVNYDKITSKNYHKVRAVIKAKQLTFFPEIISFRSELEFVSFQYKNDKYVFAFDASDVINSLTQKIDELKNFIISNEESMAAMKQEIKDKLLQEFKIKIDSLDSENQRLYLEDSELTIQKKRLRDEEITFFDEKESALSESKVSIEKKYKEQRFKIMIEKKGKFTFDWKHERKSWKAAKCRVFYDMGEDYLFEIIKEGVFIRKMINEFLNDYLQC